MARWGATQAKAQFSAVLDRAEAEGPQVVERRKTRFILMTEKQMQAQSGTTGVDNKKSVSAWEALQPAFKERYDVDFTRIKGKLRVVDLG